jgi:nicotinamide phosphoribosyltransferase
MQQRPLHKIDFYKADHRRQYTPGTVKVYSTATYRKSRLKGVNKVVFFGMQRIILEFLIREFNTYFFNQNKEKVVAAYKRRMDNALGKDTIPTDHIEALHDLGYLPLSIKTLPEGTLVPMRIPCFTITNTIDEFYWLVNYLETVISRKIWKPCTSATIAFEYRKVFERYYNETVGDNDGLAKSFVLWQGHDFSSRGMSGDEDAIMSGAGHLLSFWGTDSVDAIDFLEDYYFADSDKEIVGGSVPATEHSVMCMGGEDNELETVRRLITELYPSGPISIVWDTWDYWNGIDNTLPTLKNDIINRTGSPIGLDKVIIRPDSGDPYRIIVGYFNEEVIKNKDGTYDVISADGDFTGITITQSEKDGSIERLWSTFGGYYTAKNYRQLSPKIGLIYGDSITLERQLQILEGLKRKGFASTNVVLGIGSFTYEYVTRDTFGFAIKATYGEVIAEDEESSDIIGHIIVRRQKRELWKDPKTDDGTKKSAKGLVAIYQDEEGELYMKDQCTEKEEKGGMLREVFRDGKMLITESLSEIRERLASSL